MSFSHGQEQRRDRFLDTLTDEENGFRIIVSRLGAELVSVARRNPSGEWIGFLHRDNELAPPAGGWANHATVMGYYLHRLKDGHSLYRGKPIEGGMHSFLRSKIWRKVDSGEAGTLTYRIEHTDFSDTEYPLNVSLDLSYAIESEHLRVRFRFQNHEKELTAHVDFGLHPGFAAESFQSFSFEMPAGSYRRHFSPDNYLSGETQDLNFGGGEMPFAREKLPGSYILELVDVPERTFRFQDVASGRTVVLDLEGVPYLTLWSDGGAFLCVEPCWGLTDHHEQRAFENKEGIQTIAPGAELAAGFTISPRFHSTR